MKIYEWKNGRSYKQNPQKVGEFIEKTEGKEGNIIPQRLVELAKNPKCILHEMFTWDDDIAAERFRESQARDILGSLKYTITELGVEQIRAFVNIRNDTEGSVYKSTERVLSNPSDLQYVIEQAKKELLAFTNKYKKWSALEKTIELVEKAIETIPINKKQSSMTEA